MDLPSEIVSIVYDHLGSRADGAGASGTCRTWHEAWYRSKHWSGSITEPVFVPLLSPRTAPDVIRMFQKAEWNVPHVIFGAVTAPVGEVLAEAIVRRLRNLRTLYVLLAHPYHVDATPLIRAFPPTLENVSIHANTSWSVENGNAKISATHVSMARRSSTISTKDLPKNLRSLEIVDCNTAPLVLRDPLPELETLVIIDANDHGPIIIPLDRFPSLKKVSLKNSSVLFRYSVHDMVHAMSTEEDLEFMSMLPWHALMDYVDGGVQFPEGVHSIHVMPSGRRHYPMHVQGVNIFVVDCKRTYDFFILEPSEHMIVKRR
jgi:hypothetical protein